MAPYRRRFALALLRACGGRLEARAFQELLHQACGRQENPAYAFFPSAEGPSSWESLLDKRALTASGHLRPGGDWILSRGAKSLGPIRPGDRAILRALPRQGKGRRVGRNDKPTPKRRPKGKPILFTLGYEGRGPDAFLSALVDADVRIVLDVRKNAFSMKRGFSKAFLRDGLALAGIAYRHLPELGIDSSKRKGMDAAERAGALFGEYRTRTLPDRADAQGEVLVELAAHRRAALLCFEEDPALCHRGILADTLAARPGFPGAVRHLRRGEPAPASAAATGRTRRGRPPAPSAPR